jgi:hypothetical protein
MLRGATPRAEEIVGTAVLRIVVSKDSIKNATATSHGRSRLEVFEGADEDGGAISGPVRFILRRLREASSCRTSSLMYPTSRRLRKIGILDHLARMHNVTLSPYNSGR